MLMISQRRQFAQRGGDAAVHRFLEQRRATIRPNSV
jgi:hypothetical protein